jgi:hypothetical protein
VLDALWITSSRPRARRTAGRAQRLGRASGTSPSGIKATSSFTNAFDLTGAGLRFTRNSAGRYDAQRIDDSFRQTLGRRLTLRSDDSIRRTCRSRSIRRAALRRVRSDDVTFRRIAPLSATSRFLTGPARVSPFLADLDPSGSGRIYVNGVRSIHCHVVCGAWLRLDPRDDGAGHAPAERHD